VVRNLRKARDCANTSGCIRLLVVRGKAFALLVAASLFAACGGGSSSAGGPHTLTGKLLVQTTETQAGVPAGTPLCPDNPACGTAPDSDGPNGDCLNTGISDISAAGGTTLTITDESGKALGTTTLGAAKWGGQPSITLGSICEFDFTVPAVEATKTYYVLNVAERQSPHYTVADMKENGWNVSFVIHA
jgi:hypothetical protein